MSHLPKIPTNTLLDELGRIREREEAMRALVEPFQMRVAALDALAKPYQLPAWLDALSKPYAVPAWVEQLGQPIRIPWLDGLTEQRAEMQARLEATARIAQATESTMGALAARLATVSRFAEEQEHALRAIGAATYNLQLPELRSYDAIWRSAELASLAADRIASLRFDSIGRLAGFDAAARDTTATLLSSLTDSYEGLTDWLSHEPDPGALPSFVATLPARELVVNVELLDVISRKRPWRERVLEPPEDSDARLLQLAELHPELVQMRQGAWRVLSDRRNPDRIRQCATSIIELCDNALRRAAPDDLVKPWARPQHYTEKGALRREARWAYLVRDTRLLGHFDPVMEKNVALMLESVRRLQKIKHRLGQKLEVEVLLVMLAQVDAALISIYTVWKYRRD